MTETLTQDKVEPIRAYRELDGPQLHEARLELENAQKIESFLIPYMHSGTSGEVHHSVYNYNCTTIIVSQNCLQDIASWRKNLKPGWQNRIFKIAGPKLNVESIAEEIKGKGVKLEEI